MKKNKTPDFFIKKQNMTALLVCLGGFMINMLLNELVTVFGWPMYLDTAGTVAVAVMGGYLPGVAVGFATYIVKSMIVPASLYYGIINILIALSATYLASKGILKHKWGFPVAIIVFTLIGGGIGALIPMFIDGITFDSESLSAAIYRTGIFNRYMSYILASIITDLPDKAVTSTIALGILHIVPKRLYRYFKFNMWMQTPEDIDKMVHKEKSNVRVVSMRIKMLLVLMISLTIVAVVGTVISARTYHKSLVNEHTAMAMGTAKLASTMINGNRVDEYLKNEGKEEDYYETEKRLKDILFSSPEIAYLYVYRMEEDGFHVVFDIDTEDTPADDIGEVIPFDEGFTPFISKLLAGEEVEPIITDDEYGHLLTAAYPVYDSKGKCTCYAIADVDVQRLIDLDHSFVVEMISVFFGFFVLLCTFIVWMTDYHIIYPVRSMTMYVDDFSHHIGDSQEHLDEYVKGLRGLNIHTGDEIERLYNSICRMTTNQAEQTRSITQLSNSTAKMQDGLIITMADMVENRDSDTGAHIQKTSAYVKLIVEGLKKKGYYAEKITPKFISDVIRSSPLHDVGKINISDGVLNKPERLSPEEYEIMKTHTTLGKKIIEDAISTMEGENYLKEARNMAAYHHERWDGKGYPEELHGEVIPLSARIMAVADVFDALTSARVYKPAYSLDEAVKIIEQGKGTQFDPKCVEVFLEALPEVKVILRKYNRER